VIFHNGELVRQKDGKPLSFKLTAGKYYTESGVNKRTREQNKIREAFGLKESDVAATLGATTGADAEKIRVHGAAMRRFHDRIWQYAMPTPPIVQSGIADPNRLTILIALLAFGLPFQLPCSAMPTRQLDR
jgi:hypothetical protein